MADSDPITRAPFERGRWSQLRPLLEELLDLPPSERESQLAQRISDPGERAAAAQFLRDAERESDDLLDRPLVDEGVRPPTSTEDEVVGPWQLQRRIGAGGMGEVWLAMRVAGGFSQRAAVKRLATETPGDELLARFERERQVLASIEHPSIARLIDGGVDASGAPYIAMEFVDGVPVDRWCDERRLRTRERVELLVEIAAAVDAAHSRLVVHRDLKPSNVLIDRSGRVRLIDFGVSKVLDPERDRHFATRDVARYLTPAFASPEQFTGDAVVPATDVYSLGALAFHLLTGRSPLELTGLGLTEAVRRATEDVPPPMSQAVTSAHDVAERAELRNNTAAGLSAELSGDLDLVVARCLRKEAARRYGRAEELAAELQRWLDGRPVLAHRESLIYRARRFVGRHRALALATTVAFVSLAVGLAVALVQRDRLERQTRDLAQANQRTEALLDDLRESVRSTTSTFYAELAMLPGTAPTLTRMTRAIAAIAERQDDPRLLLEAAYAYIQVGQTSWYPFASGEVDYDRYLEVNRRAREILREVDEAEPMLSLVVGLGGTIVTRWVWAQHSLGDLEGTLALARSEAERLRLSWEDPNLDGDRRYIPDAVLGWAEARRAEGNVLHFLGRPLEAIEVLHATERELAEFDHGEPISAALRRDTRTRLADAAFRIRAAHELVDAEEAASSALARRGARVGPDHAKIDTLAAVAAMDAMVQGQQSALQGHADEAREVLIDALVARGDDPYADELPPEARDDIVVARVRRTLAGLELDSGATEDAARHARASLRVYDELIGGRTAAWTEVEELRSARVFGGRAFAAIGDSVEASRLLGQALGDAEQELARQPTNQLARLDAVDTCVALAELVPAEQQRGWWERARKYATESASNRDSAAEARFAKRLARIDAALDGR